jgi:hypothetical protein
MSKFIISLIFILVSCCTQEKKEYVTPYLNDPSLSKVNGELLDSSRYFLPPHYFEYNIQDKREIDSFLLTWVSSNYINFREPILFNYYLGNELYRLLWSRSFNNPVLISIIKSDKIYLRTKILNGHPSYMTEIYLPPNEKNEGGIVMTFEKNIKKIKSDYPEADSIVIPKMDIKIIDTTYILTKDKWNRFKELIDSCNFWSIEPTIDYYGKDGSTWILEGQNKNFYKTVERWTPHDNFRKCCEYLIGLSAAKNERLY